MPRPLQAIRPPRPLQPFTATAGSTGTTSSTCYGHLRYGRTKTVLGALAAPISATVAAFRSHVSLTCGRAAKPGRSGSSARRTVQAPRGGTSRRALAAPTTKNPLPLPLPPLAVAGAVAGAGELVALEPEPVDISRVAPSAAAAAAAPATTSCRCSGDHRRLVTTMRRSRRAWLRQHGGRCTATSKGGSATCTYGGGRKQGVVGEMGRERKRESGGERDREIEIKREREGERETRERRERERRGEEGEERGREEGDGCTP